MTNNQSGPSQRQLRVGEQLKHMIAETMQRGHFGDEYLMDNASSITVTEVRPSPDLRQATVFVISLGGENMEDLLPALNADAAMFQKEINANSNLKFTPRLRFMKDGSFEKVQRLDELLSTIKYSDQD